MKGGGCRKCDGPLLFTYISQGFNQREKITVLYLKKSAGGKV